MIDTITTPADTIARTLDELARSLCDAPGTTPHDRQAAGVLLAYASTLLHGTQSQLLLDTLARHFGIAPGHAHTVARALDGAMLRVAAALRVAATLRRER